MSDEGDAIARFLGWIVRAIGVLIMFLSGLCSAFVLIPVLSGGFGGMFQGLTMIVIVGGIPFGVGWLMWWAGSAMMPKPRPFAPRHSIADPPPPAAPDPPPSAPPKPPTVE